MVENTILGVSSLVEMKQQWNKGCFLCMIRKLRLNLLLNITRRNMRFLLQINFCFFWILKCSFLGVIFARIWPWNIRCMLILSHVCMVAVRSMFDERVYWFNRSVQGHPQSSVSPTKLFSQLSTNSFLYFCKQKRL